MTLEQLAWSGHVLAGFIGMWVVGLGWYEPSPRVIGFVAFAAFLIAAGGRLRLTDLQKSNQN